MRGYSFAYEKGMGNDLRQNFGNPEWPCSCIPPCSCRRIYIAIENKLVYTDGEWNEPSVYRVIEIKLDNETEIDLARSFIFASEDGEYSYEQARRISEIVLGADVVVRNDYGVRKTVQRSDGKRPGSRNGTSTVGDRGQIPRKKNLYSLPKRCPPRTRNRSLERAKRKLGAF